MNVLDLSIAIFRDAEMYQVKTSLKGGLILCYGVCMYRLGGCEQQM